jgi:ABC-type Fe3+-hydroxamate transport system substrate-binding protein
MNFSNEIYSGDFLGAAITLVNIEKRAEELIKEYENRIQRIAEYNKVNK